MRDAGSVAGDLCAYVGFGFVKQQISPVPGKVDLSMTVGVALPTGAAEIAGHGAQPYLQFPWSWELRDGWGLSGMFTRVLPPSRLHEQADHGDNVCH